MVCSSHGIDPDFSHKLADEHTAQNIAINELDIRIIWLSCGKKQEFGRTYLEKEMRKDLSIYKAIKIALHELVVDFFRRPNEDRRTQDLGAATPTARKQSAFLPQPLQKITLRDGWIRGLYYIRLWRTYKIFGILFVWLSYGNKWEFCRTYLDLAKVVGRDLSVFFLPLRLCIENKFFKRLVPAKDFVIKEFDIRIMWLSCG